MMNQLLKKYMPYTMPIIFCFVSAVIAGENDKRIIYYNAGNSDLTTQSSEKKKKTLDLQWLIDEALKHNPSIIAAQKRLRAAKRRIPQAKSLDDPIFRVGSWNMTDHPLNIEGETPVLTQRFAIIKKIPFPGKLSLRGEVEAEKSNMTEQELQSKIQEIIAEVKKAFYGFYYVERAIEITEENMELLRKFARIAESKYKVGKTTQRDVLAAQVELSTLANDLIVLRERRESVIARINTLLDRHPETSLGKPPLDIEKHTLDLTARELEKIAVNRRPELKRFQHAIRSNEANLKLSKKNYYFADFQPMVEYRQRNGQPDIWAASVSINIPWIWAKNREKVNESWEELSAAKSDYRFITDKTLFEIKDLLAKIRSTESTVNLYKTSVIPDAEQSLKSARIGYEADRVDFLTLIDSERLLLDSTLLYYRALADYEQNLSDLERAIGVQLTQ